MEVLAVFFFCFLFFPPSFPFCIREHTGSVLLLGGKGITLLLWAGQWQLCGLKAKEEKKKPQCEAPAVASLLPKCSRCFVFLFLCTVMIHYVPSLLYIYFFLYTGCIWAGHFIWEETDRCCACWKSMLVQCFQMEATYVAISLLLVVTLQNLQREVRYEKSGDVIRS